MTRCSRLLGAIDLQLAVARQPVVPAAVPDGHEVGVFLPGAGQLRAGQRLNVEIAVGVRERRRTIPQAMTIGPRVRLCQIERGGGKLVAEGDVRAVAPLMKVLDWPLCRPRCCPADLRVVARSHALSDRGLGLRRARRTQGVEISEADMWPHLGHRDAHEKAAPCGDLGPLLRRAGDVAGLAAGWRARSSPPRRSRSRPRRRMRGRRRSR